MSQFRIQHPWDPGFALPPNVIAEPPGRGTLTTLPIPRRTFDDPVPGWTGGYYQPEYVRAEPIGRGAAYSYPDMRRTIPLHIPPALGDDASDALRAYGYQTADTILSSLSELPRNQRGPGLEALFHAIDPTLLGRVTARMNAGEPARDALAKAMAEGFGKEILRLGRGAKPNAGLGYYGGPETLAGFWDVISYPFRKVGSGVKTVAKKTYSWGGKVLSTVGGIACGVAGSSVGAAVGGGVAAGAGVPPQYGVVGVQAASNICPKGQVPIGPPIAPPPAYPPWLLPVALGGVGIVAVVLLTKK